MKIWNWQVFFHHHLFFFEQQQNPPPSLSTDSENPTPSHSIYSLIYTQNQTKQIKEEKEK